jgi:tetratricopeptide (TPR) repeat protein
LAKAEEMFRQAGGMHPFAKLYLAAIVASHGRNDEALKLLNELSITHENMVEVYPLLGTVEFNSGYKNEALQTFRKGFRLGSKDYQLLNLGLSMLIDKRQSAEAAQWADTALGYFPGDCFFAAAKGRAWELQGDVSSAKDYYIDFLRKDASCHFVWENLGLLNMFAGDFQEAATVFENAITSPGNVLPNHYLNLGLLYSDKLGLREKGLNIYGRYLLRWPDGWKNLPEEVRTDPAFQQIK